VGRAAGRVVYEVREQFRNHPGIMNFTEKPEYGRVVDICTKDSLRELATPGLLAVLTPIAIGFGFGYAPLGAFLAGAIAAGALMAVFLANSGGAWDNAKKLVEDGHFGGKGSEAHAATVIGDTVGDPFKDTAGPAINPLIKVMNLVSLLIATSVVQYSSNHGLRAGVSIGAVAIVVAAIVISKRRSTSIGAGGPGSGAEDGTVRGLAFLTGQPYVDGCDGEDQADGDRIRSDHAQEDAADRAGRKGCAPGAPEIPLERLEPPGQREYGQEDNRDDERKQGIGHVVLSATRMGRRRKYRRERSMSIRIWFVSSSAERNCCSRRRSS